MADLAKEEIVKYALMFFDHWAVRLGLFASLWMAVRGLGAPYWLAFLAVLMVAPPVYFIFGFMRAWVEDEENAE